MCEIFDFGFSLGANHVHCALDKIAHHRFDVAPDVADFGELGRLYFNEWRTRELGEAAGNLRFSNTGWANEDDVVGRNLFANCIGRALAPPPVAHRDRHRFLRIRLTNDVTVQLGNNVSRRELGQAGKRLERSRRSHATGSSTVIFVLV